MKIKKVCEKCGSDDVWFAAYAAWDVDTQSWKLASVYRGYVFRDEIWCIECDADTNIIDQEIEETSA